MFQKRRRSSKRRSNNPPGASYYAAVDSIEIATDVVWEILLNVQEYDRIFAQTKDIPIEALGDKKSLNPVEPGTKYVEQRTLGGRDVCFEIAITVVDHEASEHNDDDAIIRIFALATHVWQCTGTSTHTLQDLTPNTCRLEITYGMIPNGLYGKWYMHMFRKRIKRDGSRSLLSDLADIKAVAEQGSK